MNLKEKIEEITRQCRQSCGILEQFLLRKGRISRVAEIEPVWPLVQRLNLPPMPKGITGKLAAYWVFNEIKQRFPNKVSRRVVKKISRHYGADLHGYGFFRNIPGKPNMLAVVRSCCFFPNIPGKLDIFAGVP